MYQQCIIVGNLGRDPEMRFTPDGTAVTDFSVAVNKRGKRRDGSEFDETTWFKVTCWRGLAETTNQYLRKGYPVMVVGEVKASAYIPREGGDPRASLELTARDVRFLPRPGMGAGSEAAPDSYAQSDEDIPF